MGAICCCVGCCCGECADGCKKWLGPQKVTKLFYFILIVVFSVPAIFVLFFLNRWTTFKDYFGRWFNCPDSSGSGAFACIGSSAIFRLSLCLLILFFLMMLIMLPRKRFSMAVNEHCFCLKYVLVVGLFIGSLWISNQVFQDYSHAARYISIGFMILQAIILLDLFYLAGIKMVKNYDNGSAQYACYLVVLSLVAETAAVGMNVLGYIYFRKAEEGCMSTLWVNVITSVILVVLPIIQLLHLNPQNSLLTTALTGCFISYLSFICQFSYDGGDALQCNRMEASNFVADIVCSTFFFILTMYGSIMGGTGQVKVTRDGNINNAMGVGDTEMEENKNSKYKGQEQMGSNEQLEREVDNEQKYTETFGWVKWHLYMCLASIYISMLITNWGSANVGSNESILQLEPSNPGFWIRLVISWAATLLYIWTMIAPRVCLSRDFSVE